MKENKYIYSLSGVKVIAMLMIFWNHSPLKSLGIDLGARGCEILYLAAGFIMAHNSYYNYCNLIKSQQLSCPFEYLLKKRSEFWILNMITIPICYWFGVNGSNFVFPKKEIFLIFS